MKYKFILVITGVFFSAILNAGSTTGWQKLNQVNLGWNNEKINFYAPTILNPAGCASTGYAQADITVVNRDRILSVGLAALLSNRDVQLVIHNADCSANNSPKLTALNIK